MTALACRRSSRLARFGEGFSGPGAWRGLMRKQHQSHSIPPAPPHDEKPARWGQTGKAKGGAIDFSNDGGWRVCQKHGEIAVTHRLGHVAVRTPHPRVGLKFPRVGAFHPRNWLFHPRFGFVDFLAAALSLSLFSLVKEREREAVQGKNAIHGFPRVQKGHPRKCYQYRSYSVVTCVTSGDANLYKSTGYGNSPRFPRSTAKYAYTPRRFCLKTAVWRAQ